MVYPRWNQQILLENGWLEYYCRFLLGRSCWIMAPPFPYYSHNTPKGNSFKYGNGMGSLVSGSVQQPLPWTQLVKYPLCLEPLFKIRVAKRWSFKWRSWRLRIHRCKKEKVCICIYTHTQTIFFSPPQVVSFSRSIPKDTWKCNSDW